MVVIHRPTSELQVFDVHHLTGKETVLVNEQSLTWKPKVPSSRFTQNHCG